ncbi:hypothetical protein ACVWWO_000687 [Bradyrhizobium sp. F1.13.1]
MAAFVLAGPELPVLARHHDLRIRKGERAVGEANAVGVVGMQMRQQHDIDALGVDAGGLEVLQRAADRALAGLEIGDTVAGIDQHELGAGVDELRVERYRDHALRHVGRLARGQRFLLRRVDDELVRHRESTRTVIDRGALVAADLVAVEARRLRAGLRHRGIGGGRSKLGHGRRTEDGGACEQMAAIEIGHGEVPF